ncbi:MAG: hypothetical protein HC912_08975 [Saprospiraceae bacterium]|nr:hypothetical protein [Saprospiraceae bacterium]
MQRTLREMLGVNAGKEWDQLYNKNNPYGFNPLKNIFSSVRSFTSWRTIILLAKRLPMLCPTWPCRVVKKVGGA